MENLVECPDCGGIGADEDGIDDPDYGIPKCKRCEGVGEIESSDFRQGDYVLAHKWSDADPGDHWCIGIYGQLMLGGRRHMIVNSDGKPFRMNGFAHVVYITTDEGAWMIANIPAIETTMFRHGYDEWGEEITIGWSVLEWLEIGRAEIARRG